MFQNREFFFNNYPFNTVISNFLEYPKLTDEIGRLVIMDNSICYFHWIMNKENFLFSYLVSCLVCCPCEIITYHRS